MGTIDAILNMPKPFVAAKIDIAGVVYGPDATPQEVHDCIQAFCKAHENDGFGIMPGYEFAHIVIDDYNLNDGDINWVIGRADGWAKEKWEDNAYAFLNLEELRRVVDAYKESVVRLLHWLLTVPEEIREQTVPYAYGGPEVWPWKE